MRRLFGLSQPWMDERLSQKSHDEQAGRSYRKDKEFDWDQYNPPENWRAELADFFKQKVPDAPDAKDILKNIIRHTGGDTPISRNITKYFKIIYAIMTKKVTPTVAGVQFNPDNHEAVAGTIRNIIEGLPYCSDGTFERVKTVYDRWVSSISLHGFLMEFRTELVETLARAHFREDGVGPGMETHRLNFYKVVANEMGINVSGAVEDKHYKGPRDRENTKTKIKEEIKKNYTPIGMVKYMEDRLRGLVPEFALKEKNAEESQDKFETRLHDHNDTMKKILGSLFDALQIKMPETITNYFTTKKITLSYAPPEAFIAYENINWAPIRELIVHSLCEQNVIRDNAKQNKKKLLKPSIKNKSELLYWYHNIASDNDLREFFNHQFFAAESDDDKRQFLFSIYTSDAKPDKLIKALGDAHFKDQLYQLRNRISESTGDFFPHIIALYHHRQVENETNENKTRRQAILTSIKHMLEPYDGDAGIFQPSTISMQVLIKTISQLSDINIRITVIADIANSNIAKLFPQFLTTYYPQLLNLTTNDYQNKSISSTYNKNTLSGIASQDDLQCLIKIMSSFKTDELKMQFLVSRNKNLGGGDHDTQQITLKIIDSFRDPIKKKLLFHDLFKHLPKDLKLPVLTALYEQKKLSEFLFAKNNLLADAHWRFVTFLKTCDEKTIEEIFLKNDDLSRSIMWSGTVDIDILEHLKLPAVRYRYLKNSHEKYPDELNRTKTYYFKDFQYLQYLISHMTKEGNREFVKPFMDLMGGIEAYIDTVKKKPNAVDLIKLINLLPEYTDPLIGKIGGMQKFIEIVTAAAGDNNPNLLTEVFENLPASTKNAFLTENNNSGMTVSVELLLLHNNFQTFFPHVLNTLSDDQKIAIVDLLAAECFEKGRKFTHFEDPERLLAVLSKLPNQAIQLLIQKGAEKIAALFVAMTIEQQSKLLSLLTNEDRIEFFALFSENKGKSWFEQMDKNNFQVLLPLIPLTVLERFISEIQNAIENKIISLPEVINILKTHQPELTQAQMNCLFLKDAQKEAHRNAQFIDLAAIPTDQPIFTLVKNLQELILLIQTVWGADNLKDKMSQWLTQFPDGLQLIEKLFNDPKNSERYSQLSMLLSEKYLRYFINVDQCTKPQDMISILSSLPDEQHRESIFFATMSSGNLASDILWLEKLVQQEPHKLTALLPLLPERLADELVDTLIRNQIISTWYKQNQLSEDGRPCHDLAIICKYSKTGLTKSLLDSCGLAAISTQASKLTDLIELINAIDPNDYAENCTIDVSKLLVNQKDFHHLFNETKTSHYPLLLRSIDPTRYIHSTGDLVNLFRQTQNPNKQKAIIETPSAFRAHIAYLLKNASIGKLGDIIEAYQCEPKEKIKLIDLCGGFRQRVKNMDELYQILSRLPAAVHAEWIQAYARTQENVSFLGSRIISSSKSLAYELAATLDFHCHTDFEKDRFIRNVTVKNIADSIMTADELAALLGAFPDDPSYEMVPLAKDLADPTNLENYKPEKIYLYIFHDEISGENELGYTVLSRDQKELCNGTLELGSALPETITLEFINTLTLETVLQQTSQNGDTLNANKTQLIQALGGMEKVAEFIDPNSFDNIRSHLPQHLQNHEALPRLKEDLPILKHAASAAQSVPGAAPAAKAASAVGGLFSFYRKASASTPDATTQTEKTKAPAPHMKK